MTRAPKAPAPMKYREWCVALVALQQEPRVTSLSYLYELLLCPECKRYVDCEHRDREGDWAAIEGRRKR